jgi:eukaryotic-like serine/threonine-protein kinase
MTDAPGSAGLARPPPPAAGDVLVGKYRVEGTVGKGGMGIVLSAQHLELGQKVAIKLLLADPSQHADAATRFLREARAAAGLHSDHVVRIYDLGTLESGVPFMVMELLRGSDLATVLESRGPLPVNLALEYVLQACDAIAEAHALGIIHRDLKPSNLFLTRRSDGAPLIKVLDFGISKALGPEAQLQGDLTETRTVLGSPFYMSPEQIRDSKSVDSRSDVWALGVILHELLAGDPAFVADTFPGICAAIVADAPQSLRAQRPEVPEPVEAIVLRCLEKNPRLRFQSVPELMRALEAQLPPRARGLPSLPPSRAVAPEVSTNAPTVALTPSDALAAPDLSLSHGPVATPHLDPPPKPRSLPRSLGIGALAVLVAGLLIALFSQRGAAPPPPASAQAPSAPMPGPTAARPVAAALPPASASSAPPAPASAVPPAPSASMRRVQPSRRPAPARSSASPPAPTVPDIRMQR